MSSQPYCTRDPSKVFCLKRDNWSKSAMRGSYGPSFIFLSSPISDSSYRSLSTKLYKPHWLTTHLVLDGIERVNPHSTKPCKPHWLNPLMTVLAMYLTGLCEECMIPNLNLIRGVNSTRLHGYCHGRVNRDISGFLRFSSAHKLIMISCSPAHNLSYRWLYATLHIHDNDFRFPRASSAARVMIILRWWNYRLWYKKTKENNICAIWELGKGIKGCYGKKIWGFNWWPAGL